MKYQNISPMYKPMKERKTLTAGQFRLLRFVAFIIFTLLLVISYTGYARPAAQSHPYFGEKKRANYTTPVNAPIIVKVTAGLNN
jgi:hypothetical protein